MGEHADANVSLGRGWVQARASAGPKARLPRQPPALVEGGRDQGQCGPGGPWSAERGGAQRVELSAVQGCELATGGGDQMPHVRQQGREGGQAKAERGRVQVSE